MANIPSSPIQEPSKTKPFNKWVVFWIGAGIIGLLLLAGINWFVIPNREAEVRSANQKGWIWISPTNVYFIDLTVDPQGKVWVLSFSEGIYRVASVDTAGQFEWITLDNKLIDSQPLSLALDSKGRIWVGADGALGMRDLNGEWRIFTPENDMDDARIFDIVVDGQDRAWINIGWHGRSGLGVIDPASDTGATYTFSISGLNGNGTSIATDQQGRVWYINKNNQLRVLGADGNWAQRATLRGDTSEGSSLAIDQQGLAWVGGNHKIYHLGPDNQWITYTVGDQAGYLGTIETIVIDHKGRVWADSPQGGVFMFDESVGWTPYDSENSGLKGNTVNAMAVDGENKIWIATNSSLNQFDIAAASSPVETNANREAAQKFTSLKNRSPIIAFGIITIVVLGITLSMPQTLGAINLPNFRMGFVGWLLVFGIYWGIIGAWARGAGDGAIIALLICSILPLPANIIAVIVLMIKPRWRWIGVGLLSALAINSIGYLLFKEIDEFSILYLLTSLPFFMIEV